MLKKILTALLFIITTALYADNFQAANQKFSTKEYKEAAKLYEEVLDSNGNDINTLFNLGNSYLLMEQKGKALYTFYKAALIDPSDHYIKDEIDDLEKELELEKQHPYPLFLSKIENWIITLSLIILLSSVIFLTTFFNYRDLKGNAFYRFRKLILTTVTLLLLISVSGNVYYLIDRNSGVVFEKSDVLISPYDGSDVSFQIREGSKIKINDEFKQYYMISDMNERYGWILKDDLGLLWKK